MSKDDCDQCVIMRGYCVHGSCTASIPGVLADLVPPRQMSGEPNLLADLDRRTFDASGFGPTRTTHASRL